LVVAEVRERLAVSKRAAQKMNGEIQSQEVKLGEVKEQDQVAITNNFAALENFEDNADINTAWETIRT
jgi:hypothetical protein